MTETSPSAQSVLDALEVRRRQREARSRRRRLLWIAGGVAFLLLVAVLGVWQINRDDSKGKTAGGTSPVETGLTTTSASSQPTSTASQTTEPTTTPATVTPPKRAPVALPLADQTKPPEAPEGLYRQGKLFLVGSVPDEATGAGFLRKAVGVLGAGNVTMDMTRDPRVPRGTMRIIVQEEFQFLTGSSVIDPKWIGLLNLGVIALRRIPEATLVLTGYTDNTGPADVNQSLSEQRAQVVARYMISHGIPANRVVALGRGSADPIADNNTALGRLKNRRIEGTLEGIRP